MKTRWLIFSFVLNGLLIAAVCYLATYRKPPTPAAVEKPAPPVAMPARATEHFTTNLLVFDWEMVESADYRNYIANLRAIGCPEQTIRDIIIADVDKLFEQRARDLLGAAAPFEFWKSGASPASGEAERLQRIVELVREKRAILKDLLGIDVTDQSLLVEALNPLKSRYSFLSADKQQRVLELDAAYARKLADASSSKDASYQFLMDEKEAAVAQLLTPQELEDYQLRFSRTAEKLRDGLGGFQSTEYEFREIFRQQKAFEKQFGSSDSGLSAEQRDLWVAGLAEKRNQLKAAMGEQRFSEYEHESRFHQSRLKDIAREFNIPKENAFQALDLSWAAQEEAMRIRTNPAFTHEHRQQLLLNVRDQMESSFVQLLGSDGSKAYLKNPSGWLSVFPKRNSAQ
jgi:hypothetical protein